MENQGKAYWYATLKLIAGILAVWAVVSYGFGIILASAFNSIHLGGYPFGFWWAQQGSIYVFIVLIFVYARLQGNLDKKFNVNEE
jgi:putative solute:sodium symporter small subunit